MARKYTRDNRGRFAATGQLMSAVARPRNTMARPRTSGASGYQDAPRSMSVGSPERKAIVLSNIKTARKQMVTAKAPFEGFRVEQAPRANWAAGFEANTRGGGGYVVNASSPTWVNPRASAREGRRAGQISSSDPRHNAFHEVGHARHQAATGKLATSNAKAPKVAGRVSRYAKTNQAEFVAEVYAGLRTGRKYDREVMQEYRKALGKSANPSPRRRSRLPKS